MEETEPRKAGNTVDCGSRSTGPAVQQKFGRQTFLLFLIFILTMIFIWYIMTVISEDTRFTDKFPCVSHEKLLWVR
ncbi:MAG TPA: hypothetical protein DCZ74_05690 [Treponema sp.]|nr:hypothetical protein [Treponema sp.]